MKKLFATLAVAVLLFCSSLTVKAQSSVITTIDESWSLGGHPPSQSACTSNHASCNVAFGTDGDMANYQFYNGGPRVNWRSGQNLGYKFAGITGLQTVPGTDSDGNPDGTVVETYSFSNLIVYQNNVMVGYAKGTYTIRLYYHETGCSRSGCWFVWSPKDAQLSATVTSQPVGS